MWNHHRNRWAASWRPVLTDPAAASSRPVAEPTGLQPAHGSSRGHDAQAFHEKPGHHDDQQGHEEKPVGQTPWVSRGGRTT